MVCDYCENRYFSLITDKWECSEGGSSTNYGCDNFSLDFDSLTERQKKAIRRILASEEKSELERNNGV